MLNGGGLTLTKALMTAFVNPIPSALNAMEKDTSNKSLTIFDPEHYSKIKINESDSSDQISGSPCGNSDLLFIHQVNF